METLGVMQVALGLGGSIMGAAVIVGLIWTLPLVFSRKSDASQRNIDPSFLLDGDTLVDTSFDAQRMLASAPPHQSERTAVVSLFQERFPTLDYVMSHIQRGGLEHIKAADGADMALRVEDVNGLIRLTLSGAKEQDGLSFGETAATESMKRELSFLRDLVDTSPHLLWAQDNNGKLTWANKAYMQVSDKLSINETTAGQCWPSKPVFADLHLDGADGRPVSRRVPVIFPDETTQSWYDVTTQRSNGSVMHFASCAAAAVSAENSKIKAMQTSGRLFGDLTTGLAIFDQKRRLTIFNPSLTDLTRLKPDFLAGRPTLDMFLDALRDSRILPEPKNYASWRDQFTALETAARAGTYCENWETIDGQTFRVTGKPYADNSFVFLFDDITAEVALTRRFRVDIETGQAVIDKLQKAIAVFSANGTLLMSNAAYKDLWQSNHHGSMHSHQLRGEIVNWQRHCAAPASWGDLRTYIAADEKRDKWVDDLILEDGRHLQCTAESLNARSTMITFAAQDGQQMAPVLSKITQTDPSLQNRRS